MKRQQIRSTTDTSATTVLLIGLTIIVVGCFLGISYLFEYDFYNKDNNGETAKTIAVQIYSQDDCEMAKDFYKSMLNDSSDIALAKADSVMQNNHYRLGYYVDYFSPEKTNFVFAVFDTNGRLLWEPSGGYSYMLAKERTDYLGSSDFYVTDENGGIIPLKINYAILIDENQASDRYKTAFDWIDAANTLKYFVFVVLFVALLIIVILLSLVTINAGTTDPETGEIIPGFIDKVPLDICTVAIIAFFAVAWMVIGLTSAADVNMVLNNLVVVITFVAFVMLLMTYLMTVSVRVKMGKFYKNTVVYMIYRRFKRKTPRKVRKAFGDMTFMGKVITGISLYIIFEASILIAMAYLGIFGGDSARIFTMFLIVWGMTRLLIVPIFVMVAINLNYIREEGEKLAGGVFGDGVTDKLSIAAFKSHGKNLDQIRKEINKAMEQELKSERLKNELITNVSHDIKTPLTSIMSYVDFLQRDNISEEERKKYLAIVAKHTDKLAVLAKNLIEVSQISSGNIEVKKEKTSLNIIIEQTIEEFALRLEQSELIPRVSLPEEEIFIMGDGEWLWRIFSNLLNNACKYAASGTDVEISLEEHNGKAFVRIANISKSALHVEGDELFERFVRGDSSRHTDGNGLGLSIARSLAELQNGTLDISVKGDIFAAVVVFDKV
ncbi:MAG: HAMP domain-containing histidine kinase [Clostridia bacterium]|nr:HAMP domain-containing histidine kinase [Clostridia bacterium]